MLDAERNRSPSLNFGTILSRLSEPTRALVRQLEKLMVKKVHSANGVRFNSCCIAKTSSPRTQTYTYVYIYTYIYIYIYIYRYNSLTGERPYATGLDSNTAIGYLL